MNEEILTAAAGAPHQSPSVTASPRGSQDGGAGIAAARTLDMVTAEIKFLDAQAGRLVMGHALEIGKRLTEAKEMVPYGEWGNYLEKELHYSQSTANKLMKVFQEFGASQMGLFGPEVESESFTNLTYSKALALLSVPREEREDFLREVDAEAMSTRELKEAIRERDEAKKRASALAGELEGADLAISAAEGERDRAREELAALKRRSREQQEEDRDTIRTLTDKIEELEARPVDVAVQEPDPEAVEKLAAELADKAKAELEQKAAREVGAAEEKAAKAAEALKKAQEKAKAEREKLEAKLKEAEAKLTAAGETDKAEAEKLRAEAEALRKQLAMSSQEITIFKLRFSAWQEAHKLMADAFSAIQDEETKEKLRAAIRAQVKAWGWTESEAKE